MHKAKIFDNGELYHVWSCWPDHHIDSCFALSWGMQISSSSSSSSSPPLLHNGTISSTNNCHGNISNKRCNVTDSSNNSETISVTHVNVKGLCIILFLTVSFLSYEWNWFQIHFVMQKNVFNTFRPAGSCFTFCMWNIGDRFSVAHLWFTRCAGIMILVGLLEFSV